jgi:hypothetical protein
MKLFLQGGVIGSRYSELARSRCLDHRAKEISFSNLLRISHLSAKAQSDKFVPGKAAIGIVLGFSLDETITIRLWFWM